MSSISPVPSDLAEKAARLKASPHFDTIYEGSARYIEKQAILLVLCGKKPVSEALSCTYVTLPQGRRSAPDDEQQVAALLEDLGLAYYLWSDDDVTHAVVSLNQAAVDTYMQARGHSSVGQLFGFPTTAIAAFTTDQMLTFEEQDRLMAAAELPEFMPQFRMSRAHAQGELKILADWNDTITTYGFDRA